MTVKSQGKSYDTVFLQEKEYKAKSQGESYEAVIPQEKEYKS